VGFVPAYWDGTTALGDLLKDPKILAHFEKGTAVVYHPKGYTRELNKAKKLNTEKQLLYISYGSEELQINLNPQEWVHTNPSLTEFKKYSM
jgi:hypothetical protein